MTNENCIFCKIVAGLIPSYKVYEDQNFFGFLDIFPLKKGHMLLIPKEHHSDILDTPDSLSQDLFHTGKILAKKIKNILNVHRVGFVVEGLEVDHVHLKLIPLNKIHEDHALEKNYKASEEELKEVQELYKF